MADHTTVARPYAKAAFDVARAAGELDGWSRALAAAAGVVADEGARAYLSRPELGPREQMQFVESVCADLGDEAGVIGSAQARNLLGVLAENDRLEALPEIAAQYERLKHEAENRVRVTLVSASDVDDEQIATVKSALERKLGRQVELGVEVDGNLLGGAVVRAEDMVIDGSVRSRLARLADSLIG